MNEVDKEDGRTASLKIAHGVMWFLIWMGFGGCMYLTHKSGESTATVKVSDSTILNIK